MNEEPQSSQAPAPTPVIPSVTEGGANMSGQVPLGTDWEKYKNVAMAARVPFLFWLPFVSDAKSSPYVMFHANQGLLLLVIFALGQMVMIVPYLYTVMWIVHLAVLIFTILGVIEASKGEMKELPFIGHITLVK